MTISEERSCPHCGGLLAHCGRLDDQPPADRCVLGIGHGPPCRTANGALAPANPYAGTVICPQCASMAWTMPHDGQRGEGHWTCVECHLTWWVSQEMIDAVAAASAGGVVSEEISEQGAVVETSCPHESPPADAPTTGDYLDEIYGPAVR